MSSPFQISRWTYDVFLSFRGEDTRKNFVDHLYAALQQKGFYTFKDDEKLERGKAISPELLKAIEESRFAIVVFSKNYAFSSWCLDELVKILQCKNMTVLPVFYDVDPSEVRKQTGSLGEAFEKHEVVLKEEMEKVQKWRAALSQAANISGWDLRNTANGLEANLIKEIVGYILRNLSLTNSSVLEGLVGMDSRLAELGSLLSIGTNDIRIVGICGMGGIGKTTIAKAVYDRLSCQFEGSSYLANVREASRKHGLEPLQEQLLSEILKESDMKIRNVDKGISMTKNRLRHMRVLVFLDDVDQINQLETLVGKHDWFGLGSRIIITTRDEHLLTAFEVNHIYKAKELNNEEAVKLFSAKAFRKNQPTKGYVALTDRVLHYAKGVPLALNVLGSFLFGRNITEWRSALDRLKESPIAQVLEILKISYEGLEYTEKKIFLDIACFFKGEDKDYVAKILDGCGFYPDIGISVLAQKSLITILKNKLLMHDLIQEMGWHIVREESLDEPGKCSRLWHHKDIYHALMKNTGTEAVEGIILDSQGTEKLQLSADAFSKMKKLRLLKICNVLLPHGLEYISNELRLLDWHGYPLRHMPSDFQPEKLVELNLCYSRIEQLWKGIMFSNKLKFIDLSHSSYLRKTPDFTGVPNLEKLVLAGCTSLLEVHPSIRVLRRLICLNLKDCKYLNSLPSSSRLKSLQILVLSGCSKLKNILEILGNMKCLSELYLDGTGIKALPLSIEHLSNLLVINLSDCKNLTSLPESICRLISLQTLNLSGCSKLDKLPENLGNMKCLEELCADRTAIKESPSSIVLLRNLQTLSFRGCKGTPKPWSSFFLNLLMPRKIQHSIGLLLPALSGLWSLKELDLSACDLLEGALPSDFGCLSSLEQLNLSRNCFVSIPESISQLSRLFNLELEGCRRLKALPELPSSIALVNAHNCTSLERLSTPLTRYKFLWEFRFSNCYKLLKNQQSYNHLAVTFLQSQLQGRSVSTREFNTIFVPGRDIPEWFSHQNNMGRSIRIQLHPNWYNILTGFAVCAVFAAMGTTRAKASVGCYLGSSDIAAFGINAPIFYFTRDGFVDSDHVCLLYIPIEWLPFDWDGDMNPKSCTQFEASFRSDNPATFVPIKCGVHLVYKEDSPRTDQTKMIQYNGSDRFDGSTLDVAQDNKLKRSHDDCHHGEAAEPSGCDCCDEERNSKKLKGSTNNLVARIAEAEAATRSQFIFQLK